MTPPCSLMTVILRVILCRIRASDKTGVYFIHACFDCQCDVIVESHSCIEIRLGFFHSCLKNDVTFESQIWSRGATTALLVSSFLRHGDVPLWESWCKRDWIGSCSEILIVLAPNYCSGWRGVNHGIGGRSIKSLISTKQVTNDEQIQTLLARS